METEFTRYSSLENTYRKKTIDSIIEQGKSGGEWHVSEKVHGANFSFLYNGHGEVEIAKRTAKIKEGDSFYDCWSVYDKYDEKIQALFNDICLTGDNLQVFGELFGPGIQKEVWYGDQKDFFAFDIKVNGTYMNTNDKNALFEKHGFPYAKSLFVGTFQECLEFNNEFDSIVPTYYGYDIKQDNVCEGVVIAPNEPKYLGIGRVVLKNKNDKFSEKAGKKKQKGPKTPTPEYKFSELGLTLLDEVSAYVCEARLRNVISKIGTITDKQFGMLMGLTVKDVLEDFLKDFEQFQTLDKPERRAFQKKVNGMVKDLIRPNFLNIIDNTF